MKGWRCKIDGRRIHRGSVNWLYLLRYVKSAVPLSCNAGRQVFQAEQRKREDRQQAVQHLYHWLQKGGRKQTFNLRDVSTFFGYNQFFFDLPNLWSTLKFWYSKIFLHFSKKWQTSFRLKLADWGKHRYELVFDKLAQAWDDVVKSRELVPCCLKRHLRPMTRWMKLKMTRRLGMSSLSLKMEISTSIFYQPSLFVKVCDRKSALRAAPRFFQFWDHWNIGMKRCLRWRVKHCAWPQFSIPPSRCFHVFPTLNWAFMMIFLHLDQGHAVLTFVASSPLMNSPLPLNPASEILSLDDWLDDLQFTDISFCKWNPKDVTCWCGFSWILRAESS